MSSNQKLNIEALKTLVFDQDQATKQNKDKLFKLAKAAKDIECIEKLRDKIGFKTAKVYLEKLINTSLEDTIKNRDIELLKYVISQSVDLSNINFNDLAQKKYSADFLRILIKNGIKNTKINIAELVRNKYCLDIISEAVELGADVNARIISGNINPHGALHLIGQDFNDIVIAKYLISKGIDLEMKVDHGITALYVAAYSGNIDLVNILLLQNVNVEVKDGVNNATPLIRATQEQHIEIVNVLLDKADVNAKMNDGWTSLHVATNLDNYDIAKMLIDKGADINCQLNDGATPLIMAAANGNKKIVQLLIDKEAKLELRLKDMYQTALIAAVNNSRFDIVELLLNNEASIDAYSYSWDFKNDNSFNTALSIAINKEDFKMAELLLSHGAYINHMVLGYLTIYDIAIFSNKKNTIEFLKKYGARSAFPSDLYESLTVLDADFDLIVIDTFRKTNSTITSPFIAKQYILEELQSASGSDYIKATEFEMNSGFKPYEYKGAMSEKKTLPEVDGTHGPQWMLTRSSMQVGFKNNKKMADIRIAVNDLIMREHRLGKYKNKIKRITLEYNSKVSSLYQYDNYLIFNTKKYEQVDTGKYYNQATTSYIIIEDKIATYSTRVYSEEERQEDIIYAITKNDFIFESDIKEENNHTPKVLVKLLTNFRKDTPIKYTTHIWDINFKDDYGDFKTYLLRVADQWNEIEEQLKELSPRLHSKIYTFLLNTNIDARGWCSKNGDDINMGWSSIKGLEEWCNAGNDPFNFLLEKPYKVENKTITTFGNVITLFKQEIQIRNENNMLLNIFTDIEEQLDEEFDGIFEFELINLKGKTFYIDTEIFKNILVDRIFKDMVKPERHKFKNIKIEIGQNTSLNYHELRIIQIGSQSNQSSHDMLNHHGADTSIIKEELANLCDWSIESSSATDNYRINYLKSDATLDDIEPLDYTPEGYTHIMRFYK